MRPPSTVRVWAVMKLDSGETRKATALAISSGRPTRWTIALAANHTRHLEPAARAPRRIAAPAAAGPDAAEERRFIDRWPWKSDASTACSSALSTGCRAPGAVSFTIFDLLRPHIYARAAAPGPASWRRTGNGPTSAAVRCRRRGGFMVLGGDHRQRVGLVAVFLEIGLRNRAESAGEPAGGIAVLRQIRRAQQVPADLRRGC